MHDGTFLAGLQGIQRAQITEIGPDGRAKVMIPTTHGPDLLLAQSLVPVGAASVGREAAVVLMDGGGFGGPKWAAHRAHNGCCR